MALLYGLRLWFPGYPLAKLFSYASGTTTKQHIYPTAALDPGAPLANPLSADGNGLFESIFRDPALAYKFVLAPSTDSDPPVNPIFTVDGLAEAAAGAVSVLSKTTDYTVVASDGDDVLILADATLGNMTITLYTAVGNSGRKIRVVKVDSSANTVTVDASGAQTIDGALTQVLSAQYRRINIASNGSNWLIFAATMIAAGTVGAPGITFDVDTDTGFYREAADTLSVSTGGVKALGIDSTQFIDSPTQPRCAVYHAVTQSISTGTDTVVLFDSELFDVGGLHSTVSNTGRFTVPAGGDGVYLVIGVVVFAANATGVRRASVIKNGTITIGISSNTIETSPTAVADTGLSIMAIVSLVAGDYVELMAYQTSGGALNISSGGAGDRDRNQAQIVKLW